MGDRIEDGHHRGDGPLAAGVVKLLLDGQQRMTSLYGVVRGKPPKFFDGNAQAFTGLRFHLENEAFAFYQPVKMKDDPLWIDVTELMRRARPGWASSCARLSAQPGAGGQGRRLRRAAQPAARHHRHRSARRGGHRRGQDARRGGGHLQPGEQRRHQALQGRPGAGQDLRRLARGPRHDEGQAQGVGQGATTTSISTGCCAR